jgi:hypothetical protein
MKQEFFCPECTAVIQTDSPQPGAGMTCPGCRENIVVPDFPIGPGTTISGYRIVGKIGVGGMGGVYLAEQTSMSRHVALKVLPHALYEDPSFLERFLGEVRMLGALHHPNIATAYDAGIENNVHYLAMEYIDGNDLHALIQRDGAMEEGEALRIAVRIAGGLEYAWTRDRLVHRDIKPGNIMIDRHAEVKILDLGVSISGTVDSFANDEEQAVLGTPHYMSPEQAGESGVVDVRADIYSLGATLYHMVTGQPPFIGESLAAILDGRDDVWAPSARDFNPKVSRACAVLIEIMMARNPADRQSDWAACRRDMERVMQRKLPAVLRPAPGESMVARPRSETTIAQPGRAPAERPPPRVLRHILVALAVAVLLVALFLWLRGIGPGLPRDDGPVPAGVPPAEIDLPEDSGRAEEVLKLRGELDGIESALQAGVQPSEEMVAAIETVREKARRIDSRDVLADVDRVKARLREKNVENLQRVMAELEVRSTPLIDAGKFEEAARVFRTYDGPLKVATATARVRRAEEIAGMKLRVDEDRYDEILRGIASLIVSNQPQQDVLASLADAREHAATAGESERLAAVEQELRAALRSQARIIPTYREDMGSEIPVRLRSGMLQLRIENVSSTQVRASERTPDGDRVRRFQLSDLSFEERSARLEKIADPATIMMRGLLSLQRDEDEAGRLLSESGGELARAIANWLRQRRDPDPEAAQGGVKSQ